MHVVCAEFSLRTRVGVVGGGGGIYPFLGGC